MSAIETLNKIHNKLNNKFINLACNRELNNSLNFINNLRFIFGYINNDLFTINEPFYKCAHNSIGKAKYEDELNYDNFINNFNIIQKYIKLNKKELITFKLIKGLIWHDSDIIDEDLMCNFIL